MSGEFLHNNVPSIHFIKYKDGEKNTKRQRGNNGRKSEGIEKSSKRGEGKENWDKSWQRTRDE